MFYFLRAKILTCGCSFDNNHCSNGIRQASWSSYLSSFSYLFVTFVCFLHISEIYIFFWKAYNTSSKVWKHFLLNQTSSYRSRWKDGEELRKLLSSTGNDFAFVVSRSTDSWFYPNWSFSVIGTKTNSSATHFLVCFEMKILYFLVKIWRNVNKYNIYIRYLFEFFYNNLTNDHKRVIIFQMYLFIFWFLIVMNSRIIL